MGNPANSPGEHDHVLMLCHMLSNRISRSFSRELERFDVSVAEWRVMLSLASGFGISGQEITNRWAMDKMAVSRAIGSLEQRGWITRRKNSRDRRSLDLELTGQGLAMYERMLPSANEHYHKLVAGLDEGEMTAFRQTLLSMIAEADRLSS